MSGLLHDLKVALRVWLKSPAHLAIMLATLMLGTGANVAMFSVADATIFRPLPVQDPAGLMRVTSSMPGGNFTYHEYSELQQQRGALASLTAVSTLQPFIEDSESPLTLFGQFVSGNYFSVLGVSPIVGRDFRPEEDALPLGKPVAVISHDFWQRQFQTAGDVLGKTVRLNGVVFTVVGVAPRGFAGTNRATRIDVWLPTTVHPLLLGPPNRLVDRNHHWVSLAGRLAPNVTREQAEDQLSAVVGRLMKAEGSTNLDTRVSVFTEWEAQSRFNRQSTFLHIALFALVSLVLFIACINVANLILAKATGRQKEVALRLALGATKGRIIRQLLVEGMVISVVGTLLGLVLASVAVDLISGYRSSAAPSAVIDAQIDLRVLLITLFICAIATLMVGLAPALDSGLWDLGVMLKSGGQVRPKRGRRRRGGRSLVVAQVGLCSLLLIFTGLFVRSVQKAWNLDPGFRTDRLMLAVVNLRPLKLDDSGLSSAWRRLHERVRGLPGVVSTAYSSHYPFDKTPAWTNIVVEGREGTEALSRIFVGPGYFSTLGIPMVKGREFREQDRTGERIAMIVDEATAEHYWPGQDPVGKVLKTSKAAPRYAQVVGVAKTVMYDLGIADQPWRERVYVNIDQGARPIQVLNVQIAGEAGELREALLRTIQVGEPRAFIEVFEVGESIGYALAPLRMGQLVLAVMALLGLVLAAIGLYGVLSFDVGRRVKELGVRSAIGAEPADLKRMVVRESWPVVMWGLGMGVGVALLISPALSEMLIGVGPRDPLSFISAGAVVFLVSLVASYFPARRASRVNVLVALRVE